MRSGDIPVVTNLQRLQNPLIVYIPAMKTKMPEPEIITRKGKAVSVIVPIKVYHEMIERLEDADDIEWLKKARKKPQSYRKLEEVLTDLGI
jgi:hypothetical protein